MGWPDLAVGSDCVWRYDWTRLPRPHDTLAKPIKRDRGRCLLYGRFVCACPVSISEREGKERRKPIPY
ncbi:hypothetical protein DOTSEDRAFT_72744 [Dothistroma septosporum NZE10]|uniref:Uncharacterized protein n=1 Tax=Dothistroma septosporum (strain NZE10 / CBS 128990) TaxID=675120 RepID=M2WN69_DOTSN|nr:hypothetical protein DOTSEDRAFT_72744 [Dothistroma septosporum NZE10]